MGRLLAHLPEGEDPGGSLAGKGGASRTPSSTPKGRATKGQRTMAEHALQGRRPTTCQCLWGRWHSATTPTHQPTGAWLGVRACPKKLSDLLSRAAFLQGPASWKGSSGSRSHVGTSPRGSTAGHLKCPCLGGWMAEWPESPRTAPARDVVSSHGLAVIIPRTVAPPPAAPIISPAKLPPHGSFPLTPTSGPQPLPHSPTSAASRRMSLPPSAPRCLLEPTSIPQRNGSYQG